jgi:hypothetical protein
MNNLIYYLHQYKQEFINLEENNIRSKFLSESFARWYIKCKKIGLDEIFPANNIIMENRSDLEYANKNKYMRFDIESFIVKSNALYKKYHDLCANILNQPLQHHYGFGKRLMAFPILTSTQIITPSQEYRLRQLYVGHINDFHRHCDILLNLYNLIDMENATHFSIPPIFSGVELFGSCINTHNNEYCSLFKLEKNFFSSLGSFWDYQFHRDSVYLCNPPFDLGLIEKMAYKLIGEIRSTLHNVIIVITIPVWNSDSRKQIGIKDFNTKFCGYDILINNEFFREKQLLDKNEYQYWNYFTETLVPVAYTHLIILSNIPTKKYKTKFDINTLLDNWCAFDV